MLVSHRHRFLFVHIYKTAGTSVRRTLEPYADGFWKYRLARLTRRVGIPYPAVPPFHLDARGARARVPPEAFERFFKFTFVRNPWDWQVSLYHWMLSHASHHQHAFTKGLGGFDAYIRWRTAEGVGLQQAFLRDEDGTFLMDYVGRMETIDDDFAEVCRTVGLPPLRLPHVNRSGHRDYRDLYTDETRELVARAFAQDIEMFGYTFDGVDGPPRLPARPDAPPKDTAVR